jgi:hypothetical protein
LGHTPCAWNATAAAVEGQIYDSSKEVDAIPQGKVTATNNRIPAKFQQPISLLAALDPCADQ